MAFFRTSLVSIRKSQMQKTRELLSRVKDINSYNIQALRRRPLQEISGSLGDLGTLLPLLIALARQGSISLSSTLVFAGIANMATGALFGVPLPVQPMKAISAFALSRLMSKAQMASAGLFIAGVVGLCSAAGMLHWLARIIPIPVVKGIQVGAGLSLINSAGVLALQTRGFFQHAIGVCMISLFVCLLLTRRYPRIPFALIVLVIGIAAIAPTDFQPRPRLQIWQPHASAPSIRDFETGGFDAGIGQLPLTTLNSIIAVSHLSADLLPERRAPTPPELGVSVAAMNLVGCWFGSMPVCHGSGGLAAQYRFGARSGASVIFLGLVKLCLGLFVGDSLIGIFEAFPNLLLGIMVFAAGWELAKVGESLNTAGARDLWQSASDHTDDGDEGKMFRELTSDEVSNRWMVMIVTVGTLLALKNDAAGFIAGMLCHWSYHMPIWWERYRVAGEGRIRLDNEEVRAERQHSVEASSNA